LALAGCTTHSAGPHLIFDRGSITKSEWQRIDKQCDFEAEKAIVSIKIDEIKAEERQRFFILCAESKGVKYVRSEYR
jgi:hypothetical protein